MHAPFQTEKNSEVAVSVLQGMVKVQIHVINTHPYMWWRLTKSKILDSSFKGVVILNTGLIPERTLYTEIIIVEACIIQNN